MNWFWSMILVPYDTAERAEAAARHLGELSRAYDQRLVVCELRPLSVATAETAIARIASKEST